MKTNKGRCFIEFSTKESAQAAIDALNGVFVFKGKLIQARLGLAGVTQDIVNEKIAKQK